MFNLHGGCKVALETLQSEIKRLQVELNDRNAMLERFMAASEAERSDLLNRYMAATDPGRFREYRGDYKKDLMATRPAQGPGVIHRPHFPMMTPRPMPAVPAKEDVNLG